ncbi:MAG: transposase [Chloroflexi bacterium]|nr:transposase [Chloroflexota bacterium]
MRYAPDRHHRRSIRLRGYDYASAGAYFVTLCAQGKACLFGDVAGHEMVLNGAGEMVRRVWDELATHYPGVALDAFVLMPNHLHGIIVIEGIAPASDDRRGESRRVFAPRIRPDPPPRRDEGEHRAGRPALVRPYGNGERPLGTLAGSLGRILQVLKALTTRAYIRGVREEGWPPFEGRLWQRNYWERVIRNERELRAIQEYIANNPVQWTEDRLNPANPWPAAAQAGG